MFESAAIALNLWEVNVEREKKKTEKCGKGLDIFSVLGYNRDKEALTNSQRPPTVNNRPLHFGRV